MIYVCVPAKNHGSTIGLLLWKVRQVFTSFRREYQLLVADDGSTDTTDEVLARYQRALPLTIVSGNGRTGYAASVERLLREALRRSDRPRRDSALVLPPDFGVSPEGIPSVIRRFESGADVVVGEALEGERSFRHRVVRRSAPWLLRPGVRVPGVRDLTSGFCALRLVTLKLALQDRGPLLETEGLGARAELVARAAAHARQVATVPVPTRPVRPDAARVSALALAFQLYRTGRRVRIPAPDLRVVEPQRTGT